MPKEQTIISHFPSSTKARAASQALSASGLTDVHVRRNSRFGANFNKEFNNPVSNAETLTGLTLYSSNTPSGINNSARVLMGADPSVSGFSAKGYGMAGGHAFTLVAFVPEDRVEEAVALIKQHDGEV